MRFARPMPFDGPKVRRCSISLMDMKSILRIFSGKPVHKAISPHFCDNRSDFDSWDFLVSSHNRFGIRKVSISAQEQPSVKENLVITARKTIALRESSKSPQSRSIGRSRNVNPLNSPRVHSRNRVSYLSVASKIPGPFCSLSFGQMF